MRGKKKKRLYPMIAPPCAVPGVEIALSQHLWLRAAAETEALEMANADEQTMCHAIAVEDDLRNRFLFTQWTRIN